MWSLYRRKEDDSALAGGLFNYTGEKLPPLKFSNGKTQEDVVNEILSEIKNGHKIIFIKGVCGSGKSAMALNLAKHFKKTSIVVPIKSLQEQYERDYTIGKFILKDNGNPLKISVIKGRNNFPCLYDGDKADEPEIPCIIEIREKNNDKLLKYIGQNPAVEKEDFSSASDIKRMHIAVACPYWSPIMSSDINPKGLGNYKKKTYISVSGKDYTIFTRKTGCKYYDQYQAYVDSDVLIFNSMKYLLETSMGRKPRTDIDIIDECDEFLDNFTNERRINLSRLHSSLLNLEPTELEKKLKVKELLMKVNDIILFPKNEEIKKIKESRIISLVDSILKNPNLAEDEETNYFNSVLEIARSFESIMDETYVLLSKAKKEEEQSGLFGKNYSSDESIFIDLVSINLADRFKELIDLNNIMVLMSGTLHSPEVLRDVFGLKDFKIIEAETKSPGEIKVCRTGLERNCSFANFSSESITRKTYLKLLDVCMANATSPTLVHVSAFKDLPTQEENKELKFHNLISQERLKELQRRGNSLVDEFLSGGLDVLFSTKCARGVDFPGDKCNSIVITRYPYPNVQGIFWQILKKEQPEKFKEFYMDKAKRDLIQKISRGIRFKGDKVEVWSPDVRVINEKFE
jgi:Rad3-related DNA helicase